MSEITLPVRILQVYLSKDFRPKLLSGMERRGLTNVNAYLRTLVDEDISNFTEAADDDTKQKHTEVQEPVETDLDSVII